MVGDVSPESLGGRSNNFHRGTAFSANTPNEIGKENSDAYNIERHSKGSQKEGEENYVNPIQMDTRDDEAELEDTLEMQNEMNKANEENNAQSPNVLGANGEENKDFLQNKDQPETFDGTIDTNPKFKVHPHEEMFDPEVLDLFEEQLPNQQTEERDPEVDENDSLSSDTYDETEPEIINMELEDGELQADGQINEGNNLEVAGTNEFSTFKAGRGFEDNMQEFEQVSDPYVDTESSPEGSEYPPESDSEQRLNSDGQFHGNNFFDPNEFIDEFNEEIDIPEQEDHAHDETTDSIVTEEDVIDLMYEDRHLSPYRKIFKEHFGSYPDEEELLHLYKQVAGDIFSLDNTDDEKERRWKIYSEVYLHHFKESHLRFLGFYPNSAEVFHFQKIFHKQRNEYKLMDPEDLRFDAEFGHLHDHHSDDLHESKFDIPDVNDEAEKDGSEQNEISDSVGTDPTEADDDDPTDAKEEIEDDIEEIDPTDVEEEEEVEENNSQEGATNTEPQHIDSPPAEGEVNADKPKEETEVHEGIKEVRSNEDSGKVDALNTLNSESNEKLDTIKNTEPLSSDSSQLNTEGAEGKEGDKKPPVLEKQETKNDEPRSDDQEDRHKEHQQSDDIDITERNEDGKVPVSTHVEGPSPTENKEEMLPEVPKEAVENQSMPASGSVQTDEKALSAEKELGESSGAPENIKPVPTSLENQGGPPSEGSTAIEDGVTTIVNKDVTTVVLDGTTMIENENGPEVVMTTSLGEKVEPSASIIENTQGQPMTVSTADLKAEESKQATGVPSVSSVEQAESAIIQSQTQHDTPQPSEQVASLSLGQQIDLRDDLQASGSQKSSVVTEEHGSVKTNGIETDPIVTNAGRQEVSEVSAGSALEQADNGVKGPGALTDGVNGTNESNGEPSTGGTFTRPDDNFGLKVDPYSPSGEYVSRSLQSHQPSANVNQPEDELKAAPEANNNINLGGGAPQEADEQAKGPQQKPETTETSNDNLPSQSTGENIQSPPAEAVTPPVVPDLEDVVPDVSQQTEAVTQPTPIVEEIPEGKDPDNLSQEKEMEPTDKPIIDDTQNQQPSQEKHPEVGTDFPPLEDNPQDPYATEEFLNRKFPDETVTKDEDEAANEGWLMWYARHVDGIIGLMDPVLIALVDIVSIHFLTVYL